MLSANAKPYIDASVPVLREHGLAITTVFYKNMLTAHPELKNLFNLGNQANGSQQQSLASAVFAYAANIENAAALAPVIERIVHKHASIGIKPSHYPIVGRYLLGAIKEVLGDAATTNLIAAWDEAYWLLAGELIAAEARLYQTAGFEADSWMKLIVVDKVQQGADIVSFTLQPADHQALPNFKPGQYVSVATYLDDLQLRQLRQYSLSDAPSKNSLRISVKCEKGDEFRPEGKVSNWLHQHVHIGDILDVSHPYGNFTPDILASHPIGLISAGVGFTPMISMLNSLADENPNRPVLFAHAARSKQHLSHWQDVNLAKVAMPYLHHALYLNECHEKEDGVTIGKMNLSDVLSPASQANLFQAESNEAEFYICGPQAFMDDQWKTLLELGISPTKIHREVFGPESLSHLI
ncbi:globin domain-containing protein [Methylotenera sp.]|uniref:globin domain-containing protein n=1 Tax=Methylotenera sp. TaxID=2051956 RepID=UPI0024899494|nr:globin domain-containing protein [Methylotenera sp.]MDI1361151.1 globin domain-containing protein [Methylotenera sp.]